MLSGRTGDAITSENDDAIRDELGDLMLHIMFYAKIGSERGTFNISEVLKQINNKLIYRHPHVFSDTCVKNSDDVKKNRKKLKTDENTEYKPVLSGVPSSLPAITKVFRIQEKVKGTGFDREIPWHIWDKILEEINEFGKEVSEGNEKNIESEIGDVFFSLINACRLYGVDPEAVLEKTNRKFIKRFNYLERRVLKEGRSLHDMSLNEMNLIWEETKKEE
ncbi:MAG: nucleoside triphosphate pyrophosphohydrolase [Bacteroidales bacterium]